MNNTIGKVLSVSGEGGERNAVVEVSAMAACARCAAGKGCGAGLFGKQETMRQIAVAVPERSSLREGDTVKLVMQSRDLLVASAIVYGWPLAGGVLGAFGAWQLSGSDAFAAAAALAGTGAGVWLARRRVRQVACLQRFTPRIVSDGANRTGF